MPGVSKPKPKSKTSGKTAAVGAKRSPLTASSEKPAPVSVPAKRKDVSREDEDEGNEDVSEDEEGPKEKKKKKVLKEKELKGKEKAKEKEEKVEVKEKRKVKIAVEQPSKVESKPKKALVEKKEKMGETGKKDVELKPVKAKGKEAAQSKLKAQTQLNKKSTSAKVNSKKAATPSPDSSEAEEDVEEDDEEEDEEETSGSKPAAKKQKVADKGEKGESESEEEEEEEEDEVLLHGFSSESDSSDEEDEGVDAAPIDVAKLPTVAKDDASVARKLERAKRKVVDDRGVLYLGRIPHGFYEDQMKAYFSQFGDVTRLRLSRNKKTGRSKHYAFIEMSSSAVAEIVAETMDNYLLMGHILRCKLVPKEDVHPELWVGANRKFRRVPQNRLERTNQNKVRTDKEKEKVARRLLKRQAEKKRKLQDAGIDYDFDSVAYNKTS